MTNGKLSIAVFSDIHSNHVALEACLEYVLKRGITTFIFLGDYVADMANPQKTMQLLYQLKDKYWDMAIENLIYTQKEGTS